MIVKIRRKAGMKSSAINIFVVLAITACVSAQALGQWRISTPRDTIVLHANDPKNSGISKFALTVGTDMYLQISGSYSFWPGQPNDGVDGAYTYNVPGWNLFTPIANPPVYNSALFDWGLYIVNSTQSGYYIPKFAPSDVYQSLHNYSARVPSLGNKFSFKINAPSGSYYNSGSGGLNIKLARWTAGIAVKMLSIDFGNVNVGTPVSVLDSIASYGIDPLQIDSLILTGTSPAGNSDFSFVSERGTRFALQTETTDEIKIIASPSSLGDINGQLDLYCHNADINNRHIIILLHVKGLKPTLILSPLSIDFGKVRIGVGGKGATNVYNSGNADLKITSTTYAPVAPTTDPTAFSRFFPPLPTTVTPQSIGQIKTFFNPKLRQHYHARLHVQGVNVPSDSVDLNGDGAEPVPVFSDSVISFGSVYSGDAVSKPLVMTNTGNWTCTVVQASIVGADKALFSFTPSDSSFIVEPDSSRKFSISFHPGNKISFTWSAYFVVVYDDNTFDSVLLVGTELPPIMDVSQHVHNFGKVRIGAWRIDTVTSIYNPNNVDVTLTEQAVRPSTHFLFVSQVPPIPSHKTTALQAEFKPLIPGPLEAYYYINANASERDSILLEGIGAVAKAIFAPQQINFGVVKSNTPVTDSTILTDSGDYPLEIVWYEIKGPDASDFSVLFPPTPKASPQSPYILNEDSSITIKVRFFTNARTGEAHYATLCIHYSDSSSDCLPLEAIEETQYLQFGQSSVDFGKVRVNTSAQKTAMFRNGSGKTLQVDSLWLTSNSSVFALLSQLGPVAAGDSGKVSINFLPTARTQYNGELHGAKGDFKTDSIQVRGIGAAPMPTFAPQVVNFGTVPLLTTQPNSFELIDTGDWQLRVIHSELVGDTYNEFTYTKASGPDPTRDTVAEQGNSLYNVTFRPTQTIVYHTAKIVFTFDDSTQGYVQLVGYDESPFLVLDADSLNFGKVRIGTSKIDSANLVSTYIKPLTAAYLNLTNITNNGFTADKTGTNITVPANTLEPIHVTFTPTIIGAFTARLTMANADTLPHYDTTFITGIGAKPIPTFMMDSTLIDTLDFGAMFNGYSATRSIVLANNGNWDISTLSKKVIGVNATDFTPNFSQQVVVTPSSSKTLAITYQASTPYQAATRYGEIDFLLDDSSVFKLYLKAQDIAPINLDLKFDNEALRPGDIVYPNLRLLSAVPDSLKLNHLKGVIQWDPAVVSLIKVEPAVSAKGKLVLTPPATGSDIAGQYTYDLDGASNNFNITSPIALLRMTFQPAPAAQPGMQSPLQHAQFSLPKRTEFLIQEVGGILLIDSTCGDTHLTSGSYTANYIDMNTPNPFGGDASNEVTSIHYNIAQDGTDVLIRIIDITGREVMRPVDHARQKQGYYQLNISARDVPASGTYFYEFTAGADTPVVKKMLVRK